MLTVSIIKKAPKLNGATFVAFLGGYFSNFLGSAFLLILFILQNLRHHLYPERLIIEYEIY